MSQDKGNTNPMSIPSSTRRKVDSGYQSSPNDPSEAELQFTGTSEHQDSSLKYDQTYSECVKNVDQKVSSNIANALTQRQTLDSNNDGTMEPHSVEEERNQLPDAKATACTKINVTCDSENEPSHMDLRPKVDGKTVSHACYSYLQSHSFGTPPRAYALHDRVKLGSVPHSLVTENSDQKKDKRINLNSANTNSRSFDEAQSEDTHTQEKGESSKPRRRFLSSVNPPNVSELDTGQPEGACAGFRQRCNSAPAVMSLERAFGRELRRISDEFDESRGCDRNRFQRSRRGSCSQLTPAHRHHRESYPGAQGHTMGWWQHFVQWLPLPGRDISPMTRHKTEPVIGSQVIEEEDSDVSSGRNTPETSDNHKVIFSFEDEENESQPSDETQDCSIDNTPSCEDQKSQTEHSESEIDSTPENAKSPETVT